MIHLKDKLLVELIRGAFILTVWLNRNALHFNQTADSVRKMGAQIIALPAFGCKAKSNNTFFKLSLMLPSDVSTTCSSLFKMFNTGGT